MSEPIVAEVPKPKRVNLRRPDIMEAVREEVELHYRSQIVEKLRQRGGELEAGGLKVRLAKEFGFCYGVERAIDLAYAARKVFPNQPIYILGEIIHNPEVNEQLVAMSIKFLRYRRGRRFPPRSPLLVSTHGRLQTPRRGGALPARSRRPERARSGPRWRFPVAQQDGG